MSNLIQAIDLLTNEIDFIVKTYDDKIQNLEQEILRLKESKTKEIDGLKLALFHLEKMNTVCTKCKGRGVIDELGRQKCPKCNGTGM